MKLVLSALLGALVGPVLMLGTALALPSPTARAVPEFSASGSGTALFVIAGGLFVLAGRRRKQAR